MHGVCTFSTAENMAMKYCMKSVFVCGPGLFKALHLPPIMLRCNDSLWTVFRSGIHAAGNLYCLSRAKALCLYGFMTIILLKFMHGLSYYYYYYFSLKIGSSP